MVHRAQQCLCILTPFTSAALRTNALLTRNFCGLAGAGSLLIVYTLDCAGMLVPADLGKDKHHGCLGQTSACDLSHP